jgi:hypothetical protein
MRELAVWLELESRRVTELIVLDLGLEDPFPSCTTGMYSIMTSALLWILARSPPKVCRSP